MRRRTSRTVREARDQLSFFDPSGDLPNLREEARRITVATEHQDGDSVKCSNYFDRDSRTVKMVPSASEEVTPIAPPWPTTISLVI